MTNKDLRRRFLEVVARGIEKAERERVAFLERLRAPTAPRRVRPPAFGRGRRA